MPLLNGEAILPGRLQEAVVLLTDAEIDNKYAKGDVRIVTEQARYPLVTIPSLLKPGGQYKLNPDYQRRHRWDNTKRSRLIESFIINVPVPPVFLYEGEFSRYEVMDGLQRLTTIVKFYNDEFALENLVEWKELNGRTYSSLPDLVRKGIDRRYISSIILLQETAKSMDEALRLKQMVFERINSGGEILSPQESRNAIYDGPLNQMCIELSSYSDFKFLWNIDVEDEDGATEYQENKDFRTMKDVELVLRFFAERQGSDLQRGELIYLKDYLDYYLREGNMFQENVIIDMSNLFRATVTLAKNIFGNSAFWLFKQRRRDWGWFERPTTVVYDPIMYALAELVEYEDVLLGKKERIRQGIEDFYKENKTLFEGRNTTRAMLTNRECAFIAFFESYLEG